LKGTGVYGSDIREFMSNLDEDSSISGNSDFTSSQVRTNQSMNLNTIKKMFDNLCFIIRKNNSILTYVVEKKQNLKS